MTLIFSLILSLSALFSGSFANAASSAGPYPIQTAEYKLPAQIMTDIRPDLKTELWGKVFWPVNAPKTAPMPTLFFLHGNHGTCGSGTLPRSDGSCEYTQDGACPTGYVVTPNHEGYNYIAENLASYGYLVISINANRGITCAGGVDGDFGANLIRGKLILKHLAQWSVWNQKGGLPKSLSADPNFFKGRLAFDHVGLMGHSRGGEGVRAALNLYQDANSPWPAQIPGLTIEAIYEIGAVDGQTSRVLNAKGVAWNQVLPACDGDVSTLEGANVFDRMIKDPTEPATAQKSLTLVYGANHNFFNTQWQESDSSGCFHTDPIFDQTPWLNDNQAKVNLELMSRFFRAHVGAEKDLSLAKVFDPVYALPVEVTSITRVDRDFVLSPSAQVSYRIDDFDQISGSSTQHLQERVKGEIAQENKANHSNVQWLGAGAGQTFEIDAAATTLDLSQYETLEFRVSLGNDVYLAPDFADFSVSLLDSLGHESQHLKISDFVKLDTNGSSERELYQTIRIPLVNFTGTDLSLGKTIRFTFDQSPKGAIDLANLWLVKKQARESDRVPDLASDQKRLSNVNGPAIPSTHVPAERSQREWTKSPSLISSRKLTISSEVPFLAKDALLTLILGSKIYTNVQIEDYQFLKKISFVIPDSDAETFLATKSHHASIVYGSQSHTPQVWDLDL